MSDRLRSLAAKIKAQGPQIVGVDGYHSSGKTTISGWLGAELSIPVVHLDTYLRPHEGTFLTSLRLEELAHALVRKPVIVEGVCLLAALSAVGLRPDFHIYVDGPRLQWGSPRASGPLLAEVEEYHREWRPDRRADTLFQNDFLTYLDDEEGTSMQYRVEVDVAYIKAKTALAITLAIGGMLALCVGVLVLLYGVNGQDELLFKIAGAEMSAKGLGGVIMGTSAVWAYCAYRSRPKYSRVEQTSEKRSADGGMERSSYTSATQFVVSPVPYSNAPPADGKAKVEA